MKQKNMGLIVAIILISATIIYLERPGGGEGGITPQEEPDIGIEIGQRAPDFMLKTPSGRNVRLNDFRSKAVFINFWATWCPFCIDEMPDMEQVSKEFEGDLVVLGVNVGEDAQEVARFIDELGVTYTILLDTNLDVATGYGVRAMPSSYFIDREGKIVDVGFGALTYEQMRERVQKTLEEG